MSKMNELRNKKQEIIDKYRSGTGAFTLAKEYGCGTSSIRRLLEENKITTRKQMKLSDHKEEFIELYSSGKTINEIAEHFGVRYESVSKYRTKLKLPSKRKIQKQDITKFEDKIISMYEEGFGCTRIGRAIGFSESAVTRFLRNKGFDIRGVQSHVSIKLEGHEDYIRKQYLSGVSTCTLGQEFGCSNAAIYVFLRDKCDVEIREVNYAKNKAEAGRYSRK